MEPKTMKHVSMKTIINYLIFCALSLNIHQVTLGMGAPGAKLDEPMVRAQLAKVRSISRKCTLIEEQDYPSRRVSLATAALDAKREFNSSLLCMQQCMLKTKSHDDYPALMAGIYDMHRLYFHNVEPAHCDQLSDDAKKRVTLLHMCVTLYFPETPLRDFFPCFINVSHIAIGTRHGGGHIIACEDQFLNFLKKYSPITINRTTGVRYGIDPTADPAAPATEKSKTIYPLQLPLLKSTSCDTSGRKPMESEQQDVVCTIVKAIMEAFRDSAHIIATRPLRFAHTQALLAKIPQISYYIEIMQQTEDVRTSPGIVAGDPDVQTVTPTCKVITAYPIFNVIEWHPGQEYFVIDSSEVTTNGSTHTEIRPEDYTGQRDVQYLMSSEALRNLIRINRPAMLYNYTKLGTQYYVYDIAPLLSSTLITKEYRSSSDAQAVNQYTALTSVQYGIFVIIPASAVP